MAEKKPAGKPAAKPSGGSKSSEGEMIFIAVIAVVILFVVLPTVLIFFGYSGSYGFISDNFVEKASSAFSTFVDTVSFLAIFVSLLFIMGMIYAKTRLKEISEAYSAHLKAVDDIGKPAPLRSNLAGGAPTNVTGAEGIAGVQLPGAMSTSKPITPNGMSDANGANPFEQYMQASRDTQNAKAQATSSQSTHTPSTGQVGQETSQPTTNPRWVQIEKNMQSHNMSEWRIAILEADILLYDMLSQMGYPGNSIGEILKNVDKKNFVTLDDAWKAHRIRNIIAHEGANYELSRDEAERTIRLYKRVFDEFYFV
ncbi:MAG: hypothetical protein K9M11_02660 [Candidatus Pacebacteria bacterium]|nr:hypothetical protein [Candidatus Paceibacterota bacterium]